MPQQSDTVLLVEDDVELSNAEVFALSAEGYRVIVARDGRAALEQLTHASPSVILLDMRMPGMNGSEFMKAFRATYGHDIPVVVVTATDDVKGRATGIGADDWLAKPFELEDLLAKVALHSSQSRRARQPSDRAKQ